MESGGVERSTRVPPSAPPAAGVTARVESVEGEDREKYENARGVEVSLDTGNCDMEGKARVVEGVAVFAAAVVVVVRRRTRERA